MAGANKEEFPPLLQIGHHDLDVNARRRLCVERFGNSVTRPRILANLENTITQINQQSIPGEIWIDGSFLTEKLNPDDADIGFFITRATHKSLSPSQRQYFNNFRQTSLYDLYKIDNYGVMLDPGTANGDYMYAYWLRQFGFSRSDEIKGIIRVAVPFLVRP